MTEPAAQLWQLRCESKHPFEEWLASSDAVRRHRVEVAQKQAERLRDATEALYDGVCWVCRAHAKMKFDLRYSGGAHVNWRERLVCEGCHLNARLRLSLQIIEEQLGIRRGNPVYLTEHLTPLAKQLVDRSWAPTRSEFLENVPRGETSPNGIRCEDLTRLTFSDGEFAAVLCFDVLEHIPDYGAALREMRRVLRPGGRALLSFPFIRNEASTLVRARVQEDGSIEHLCPPELHGNPVDPSKGVLCYYHFGWDILDEMRRAGFSQAYASVYWSSDYAYIGPEHFLFVGECGVANARTRQAYL